MEIIETKIDIGPVIGREMTPAQIRWSQLKGWCYHSISKHIPRLVWIGDEVDVHVTFKDIGALGGQRSRVWDAQDAFRDMGIGFDTGSGGHGRDWEWDWSLRGPISVTFRARAREPQKRTLDCEGM